MKRNPLNYGVTKEYGIDLDCDLLVEDKITTALKELGRIASHYYIKCETMKILCE